jgi:hypothetical protein
MVASEWLLTNVPPKSVLLGSLSLHWAINNPTVQSRLTREFCGESSDIASDTRSFGTNGPVGGHRAGIAAVLCHCHSAGIKPYDGRGSSRASRRSRMQSFANGSYQVRASGRSGRRFDGHPKPTAGSLLIYTSLPETHFHAQSVTFPGCS